jgi:hypothetical protein
MKDKILSEMHNDVNITLLSKKNLLKLRKEIKSEAIDYVKDLNKLSLTSFEDASIWEMVHECEKDITKIDNYLKTLE